MTRVHINGDRLLNRLNLLGEVGALPGGGVCRLALTEADKSGRDLVMGWMRDLGLSPEIDRIGNVVGVRPGLRDLPPIMIGSHIDTVATGGLYDGNLGVLAGLEVVETLNDAGLTTERPLAVAFFTNEEGARFQPDMMGSFVYNGGLDLAEALATRDADGVSVGEALSAIGYEGPHEPGFVAPAAYLELHIEQGPVLAHHDTLIGCVTGVQGISWQELTIEGVSNHAGTTPMALRKDAGYAAARIMTGVRDLTRAMGGDQVGTCGFVKLSPNLVNVIARKAVLTVDLRHTDEARLQEAEQRFEALMAEVAAEEQVRISTRRLCRFEPIPFDPRMIALVTDKARAAGLSHRVMPSGAGHDAGLFAARCPVGMIFVPSEGGISHNVREYTKPEHLVAGADLLLDCVLDLAARAEI